MDGPFRFGRSPGRGLRSGLGRASGQRLARVIGHGHPRPALVTAIVLSLGVATGHSPVTAIVLNLVMATGRSLVTAIVLNLAMATGRSLAAAIARSRGMVVRQVKTPSQRRGRIRSSKGIAAITAMAVVEYLAVTPLSQRERG